MFEAVSSDKFTFVLEFNLPKEIFNNHSLIRLPVYYVTAPTVEIPSHSIGYKSRHVRTPGEIHCVEHYKRIKDVLPLINRWINDVHCIHSNIGNKFVEAKLHAYKDDNSLFKKWNLVKFNPLLNPNIEYYADDAVELIFRFENLIDENK